MIAIKMISNPLILVVIRIAYRVYQQLMVDDVGWHSVRVSDLMLVKEIYR